MFSYDALSFRKDTFLFWALEIFSHGGKEVAAINGEMMSREMADFIWRLKNRIQEGWDHLLDVTFYK